MNENKIIKKIQKTAYNQGCRYSQPLTPGRQDPHFSYISSPFSSNVVYFLRHVGLPGRTPRKVLAIYSTIYSLLGPISRIYIRLLQRDDTRVD